MVEIAVPPDFLASALAAVFLFTRSKNSCRHFECLMCSILMFTRFSM